MNKWIKIKGIDELKSGDIIEVPGEIFGVPMIIRHYALLVIVDGRLKAIQNTGKKTHIEELDKVLHNREIIRVLRTGLTDEVILKRYESCRHMPYSFFFLNCEDHILAISGITSLGFDQRRFVASVLLVLIIIALYFILRKI